MLIGVRQQDLYVHNSDDNSSFADHMAQSMEHWIKMMKRHLRGNCNSRDEWRTRLMQFMDCFTVGSVGYNLIDFKQCVLSYSKSTQLIYEATTTPMLEGNLICEMPQNWFGLYQKVNAIQFGDPIPDDVSAIWNQHFIQHNRFDGLQVHLNDISAFDLPDNFSAWDSDVEGPLNEELQGRNRISKVELMRLLQEQQDKENQ